GEGHALTHRRRSTGGGHDRGGGGRVNGLAEHAGAAAKVAAGGVDRLNGMAALGQRANGAARGHAAAIEAHRAAQEVAIVTKLYQIGRASCRERLYNRGGEAYTLAKHRWIGRGGNRGPHARDGCTLHELVEQGPPTAGE